MATIDSKIPEGALAEKWTNYKAHQKLVNPVGEEGRHAAMRFVERFDNEVHFSA